MPELTDQEFAEWVELIEARTGLRLSPARKIFVATGLRSRMRERNIADYRQYFEYVTAGTAGTVEWNALIDRLTVHETCFFRHPPSVGLLRTVLLSRSNAKGPLDIRIWSVGCATGEEAYSLAMLTDQLLSSSTGPAYFGVTATDISLNSLAMARRGVYHRSRLKNVPAPMLKRYMRPLGHDQYEVVQELRKRVCFVPFNIQRVDSDHLGKMDVIYCQNMLIYFARERRVEIAERLARHLRPGGTLVLGVGELPGWSPAGLVRLDTPDTLAYRKNME